MLDRPLPPPALREIDSETSLFVPAPEIVEWARASFIGDEASSRNPDHDHLVDARLVALWTNARARRQMREIAATCEIPAARGAAWVKTRQEAQLREWFGEELPDFLLTFSAPYAISASDLIWCARVEHELYHAAQEVDANGWPRFSRKTGRPIYGLKDHDVNGWVGVARRYGPVEAGVLELKAALEAPPEVGAAGVEELCCGTCGARWVA